MAKTAGSEPQEYVASFGSFGFYLTYVLSLLESPDDEAKSAAYREAFAREEIMLELQNSVQRRSTRPFGEDPAEKRQQLVLEEIFAARSQTIQA